MFFSSSHGTFSGMDPMLGYKISLGKFKKTEIISSIFSNHDAMRLENNHKNKKKTPKMWRLSNMLQNKEEINT